MPSSKPTSATLELSDGSCLIASHYSDFVLLRGGSEQEATLASIGRMLFEHDFDFFDEVICTEVEICLSTNDEFELESLREIGKLDSSKQQDSLPTKHELSISVDEEHEDWVEIERHTGLSREAFIDRLLGCELHVAMTGFLPGFVYLGGLPDELHVPRKKNPSKRTAPGTFAIGGKYAGIYSLPSAAGWNCIGQISDSLFDKNQLPPVTLGLGDLLTLWRVDQTEVGRLKAERDSESPPDDPEVSDEGLASLVFEKPGTLSLVQDQGRIGVNYFSIPSGGCLDRSSARLANTILCNAETSPVVECHFSAPQIRFESDATICLTGADMQWSLDGVPVQRNRTVAVSSGSILDGSTAIDGCRAYIAVRGEIKTSQSLGSSSTYSLARMGGNDGKPFSPGDVLRWTEPKTPLFPLQVKFEHNAEQLVLKIERGPEFNWLDEASKNTLAEDEFSVNRVSDRMGARLDGPKLSTGGKRLKDSVPLLPGMIQLTPDGQLIVVLHDGQTTGGYPRVGYLDRCSVERLSQTKIGHPFRFEMAE